MIETIALGLGLISSIITITYVIFGGLGVRGKVLTVVLILVSLSSVIWATSLNSELQARARMQKAAASLLEDRHDQYTAEGFIQAGLIFLEAHQHYFPDTYLRTSERFKNWDCVNSGQIGSPDGFGTCGYEAIEFASEMSGIIRAAASVEVRE